MVKTALVILIPLMFAGCANFGGDVSDDRPSRDDLSHLDALTTFNERGTDLTNKASSEDRRAELREYAHAMHHQHRERSERIERWRKVYFADEPKTRQDVLPCMGKVNSAIENTAFSTDLELLDTLIAHRDCAAGLARIVVAESRNESARRVASEALRQLQAEIAQLRTWRTAWQ